MESPNTIYIDTSEIPKEAYAVAVRCSHRLNVPAWLILAIGRHESKDGLLMIGDSGEIGYMQILPATGAAYGYNRKQLRQLALNIECAAKILADYLDQYDGNIAATIAAYNKGRAIVIHGKYKNQEYVDKVYAALNELRGK
jgi:soluble lytic murein transglycosylase-like protein